MTLKVSDKMAAKLKKEIDRLREENSPYQVCSDIVALLEDRDKLLRALEEIAQEPQQECGGCNLKGLIARELLKSAGRIK